MTQKPKPPKKLPHEIIKAKAQNFRQHSRQRAKKLVLEHKISEIPDAKQIENWLLEKLDLTNPKKPVFYCAYTGDIVKLSELEIDHINPITQGGGFGFENLCITSKRINGIKGDMTCPAFMKLLELLNEMLDHDKKSVMSRLYSGNRRFIGK